MKQRLDEVSQYYDTAKCYDKLSKTAFFFMAIFSIFSAFFGSECSYLDGILQVTFPITIAIYAFLSVFVVPILIRKADNVRRMQMLSDSFNTPLVTESTRHYYNNEYGPGVLKMGFNTLENAFFTKAISGYMLSKYKRLVSFLLFILWLAVILFKKSDFSIIVWLSQFVFMSGIIASWVNLELLHYRVTQVYERLYNHFLHDKNGEDDLSLATILNEFSSYESAKAAASVILSSKYFHKHNLELSAEWKKIKSLLKSG